MRGTYLPDTERCATGNPYRPPSYLSHTKQYDDLVNAFLINCYVDLQVADYILGTGPSTLDSTEAFLTPTGWVRLRLPNIEEGTGMSERAFFEDLQSAPGRRGVYGQDCRQGGGAIHWTVCQSSQWKCGRAFTIWDVQQREDDTVIAVHPDRDLWRRLSPDDYQTHQSKLEMELPAFKQAVTAAHQARVTEYGGRIGPSDAEGIIQGAELPMLVSSVNGLKGVLHRRGLLQSSRRSAGAAASRAHLRQRYGHHGPRKQPGTGERL